MAVDLKNIHSVKLLIIALAPMIGVILQPILYLLLISWANNVFLALLFFSLFVYHICYADSLFMSKQDKQSMKVALSEIKEIYYKMKLNF